MNLVTCAKTLSMSFNTDRLEVKYRHANNSDVYAMANIINKNWANTAHDQYIFPKVPEHQGEYYTYVRERTSRMLEDVEDGRLSCLVAVVKSNRNGQVVGFGVWKGPGKEIDPPPPRAWNSKYHVPFYYENHFY